MISKPTLSKGIFLDRDGVVLELIEGQGGFTSIHDPSQIVYRPGFTQFQKIAVGYGYVLCIVTNQPDVSRGKQTLRSLNAIHDQILKDNPIIGDIYVCPHDDHDACNCRKPKPGLLYRAAENLNLDLEKSVLIGDRLGDLEAARVAGCDFILLRSQASSQDVERASPLAGNSWSEVTDLFLGRLET